MKYPCNVIRDLIPLYIDKICTKESEEVIKQHLENCSDCKAYLQTISNADKELQLYESNENNNDFQKISSFRAIKKKILYKQIITAVIVVILLLISIFVTVNILKNSSDIVTFENNLSVSMVDGDLIGRLYGSEPENVKIKRISSIQNEKEINYIFYSIKDTKWNRFITSDSVFSEYLICPKDKSANQINFVYYYTGDYSNLENLSNNELQRVLQSSILLWKADN